MLARSPASSNAVVGGSGAKVARGSGLCAAVAAPARCELGISDVALAASAARRSPSRASAPRSRLRPTVAIETSLDWWRVNLRRPSAGASARRRRRGAPLARAPLALLARDSLRRRPAMEVHASRSYSSIGAGPLRSSPPTCRVAPHMFSDGATGADRSDDSSRRSSRANARSSDARARSRAARLSRRRARAHVTEAAARSWLAQRRVWRSATRRSASTCRDPCSVVHAARLSVAIVRRSG